MELADRGHLPPGHGHADLCGLVRRHPCGLRWWHVQVLWLLQGLGRARGWGWGRCRSLILRLQIVRHVLPSMPRTLTEPTWNRGSRWGRRSLWVAETHRISAGQGGPAADVASGAAAARQVVGDHSSSPPPPPPPPSPLPPLPPSFFLGTNSASPNRLRSTKLGQLRPKSAKLWPMSCNLSEFCQNLASFGRHLPDWPPLTNTGQIWSDLAESDPQISRFWC